MLVTGGNCRRCTFFVDKFDPWYWYLFSWNKISQSSIRDIQMRKWKQPTIFQRYTIQWVDYTYTFALAAGGTGLAVYLFNTCLSCYLLIACSFKKKLKRFFIICREPLDSIFSISYLWFGLIGLVIGVSVGLIVSFLSGKKDPHQTLCIRKIFFTFK